MNAGLIVLTIVGVIFLGWIIRALRDNTEKELTKVNEARKEGYARGLAEGRNENRGEK